MENTDLLYLIAFISTLWYASNLLADCMLPNRPIKSHLGYGLIAIASTWYIVTILSLIMILIVFCYTCLALFNYIDNHRVKVK